MTFHDASKEFELDCKVRHLSPKTIDNYTKQLRYLEKHLSNASILEPFCEPECISFRARMHQKWCAKYQGEARCLRMDWVSR